MLLTEEEKKERRKVAVKKYYETHKAEVHFRNNQWAEMNPEKRRAIYTNSYNKRKKPPVQRIKLTDEEKLESKHRANKKYADANRDKIAVKNKRWRLSRPGLYALYCLKRRSLKKGNGAFTIRQKDIPRMLQRQNRECFWCGKKLSKYHIDHVMPLAKGGRHSIGNIVLACPDCNRARSSKMPIVFKLLTKVGS